MRVGIAAVLFEGVILHFNANLGAEIWLQARILLN